MRCLVFVSNAGNELTIVNGIDSIHCFRQFSFEKMMLLKIFKILDQIDHLMANCLAPTQNKQAIFVYYLVYPLGSTHWIPRRSAAQACSTNVVTCEHE